MSCFFKVGRILSVFIILTSVSFGNNEQNSSSAKLSAQVELLLIQRTAQVKKDYWSRFMSTMRERFREDFGSVPLVRLESLRDLPTSSSEERVMPWETLIISMTPEDKSFPGVNGDKAISKEGIPVLQLAGYSPEALRAVMIGVNRLKPPLKKIQIVVGSHGNVIPGQKRHTGDNNPQESALLMDSNWHLFKDYLAVLKDTVPNAADRLSVLVDACLAGSAQDDLLRFRRDLVRQRPADDFGLSDSPEIFNMGLATSSISNEVAQGAERISLYEQRVADVLVHGGVYDTDRDGVLSSSEFQDAVFGKLVVGDNQAPTVNPYLQLPVVATGSEEAIRLHQTISKIPLYGMMRRTRTRCRLPDRAPTRRVASERNSAH